MFNRLMQVIKALTARLTPADWQLVSQYLSPQEQELFLAMSIVDQAHAVAVARDLLEETKGILPNPVLIQSALLHDIGKSQYSLKLYQRIVSVLFHTILGKKRASKMRHKLRKWGMQHLRKGLFIYYCHPRLGASIAREVGLSPEVVQLIRLHHRPPRKEDSYNLILLRRADSRH